MNETGRTRRSIESSHARAAVVLFAAVVLLAVLVSCEPDLEEPVSPSERMALVVSTVNASAWAGMSEHLHPFAADFAAVNANPASWAAVFALPLDGATLALSGWSATVDGAGVTYTFMLEPVGSGVFKIRTIQESVNGTTVFD